MTYWQNEWVVPVSPKSTESIIAVAEWTLGALQPTALVQPEQVDVLGLVEHRLPKEGVHFVPASRDELPDSEAETNISLRGDIEVLIREEQWHDLIGGGRQAHRARATACHELGHVVLHVPEHRRKAATALYRRSPVRRTQVKPYRDPEWQAWTFALAFLMPVRVVRGMGARTPAEMSEVFGVSETLATTHLKRFERFL